MLLSLPDAEAFVGRLAANADLDGERPPERVLNGIAEASVLRQMRLSSSANENMLHATY